MFTLPDKTNRILTRRPTHQAEPVLLLMESCSLLTRGPPQASSNRGDTFCVAVRRLSSWQSPLAQFEAAPLRAKKVPADSVKLPAIRQVGKLADLFDVGIVGFHWLNDLAPPSLIALFRTSSLAIPTSCDQNSLSQARSKSHCRMSSHTKTCTCLTSLHPSDPHYSYLLLYLG